MDLQRTRLKIVQESNVASKIDAIVESVATLRARMESSADPGYGYGQSSKTGPAAGGPKFTKKPAKGAKA